MKLNKRLWLGAAIAAAAIPLMASSAFSAPCPGDTTQGGIIELKDAAGNDISGLTTSNNTPYSPKQTCMTGIGCHTVDEYASGINDPVNGFKDVTKTQGVLDSDGEVYWQSYNVTAHAHGAVVGRHSQQGRNEDYSIAMKTAFGDAFFTSSPGMFGKY